MLFKEINAVYTENHINPYIENTKLLIFKADDANGYHWTLRS
jgi:hypothetical protein